ncbi:VOC family protein [Nocardia brasiliensis]|uniref:VOC domain-containing protein n=2 Tax=Nocardia brasiliensis TaxID=37326 RepID=K0EVP3_NOCB7|nr:VOC family protein [Nocardia brasiliensis]AFU01149.1 hypothetical protein O3I_015940 [Nocardia brasiliensis ATCC 700358]
MADSSGMQVGMFSFDCRDAAALAEFWAAVLQRTVDPGATTEFATIGFDGGGPTWMFHRPDGEPAAGPNRLMLDLGGEPDWAEQADRIEALGAERISDNDLDGVRWVVFHDPEGNTFRIFAPRPV